MTTTSTSTSTGALMSVLVPAVLVTVIASDMVTLTLPSIGDRFGASEAATAWVVTGFLLMFAVGIPFYGRLADGWSVRTLMSVALALYVAGAVASAAAPSLLALVAGRVLTGVGAAGIPVLAMIAVARFVPADRRGAGIGLVSAAAGVGTAAGPALGGLVGDALGWRSLFWIVAGVGTLLLLWALRAIPRETAGAAEPFDVASGILLGIGAGLLLLTVTQLQATGADSPVPWTCLVAGGLALAGFAVRNSRASHPFVPWTLFTSGALTPAVVVAFLAMATNLGVLVCVPLLLIEVAGLTPTQGALAMIPAGVVVAVASPLSGRVADRVGARRPIVTGLVLMAAGTAGLAGIAGTGDPVLIAVATVVAALGFILVMTPLITATAASLPPEHVGIGLGLLQGAQFLGAGAGPAILTAVLVATRDRGGLAPWSDDTSAGYPEAFVVMSVVALVTLTAASRIGRTSAAASHPAPSRKP